jgi:N-acetylglucosaminyl-diphospho-decaprenol L-rhamnosyltransferase
VTTQVIVVTYNSREHIGRCLAALVESSARVWVVDNASVDETVAFVEREFPQVNLIANDENVGFARAVNQALARAEADVVVLVNPDCVVPPSTLEALTGYLADDPNIGVVAPRLVDEENRIAVSAHPFENAFTVVASRFGGSLLPVSLRRLVSLGRRRQSYEACRNGGVPSRVDWVSGACLAVRGPLFRRLGGLDDGYFMFYEDEDLCLQVWRAGASVVYLPSVEAVHAGGASSTDPARVWPHLYRSLLRFQARHRPRTYALVRGAVLTRALAGIALGAGRDAVALARRKPARRTRAWAAVARVAALESRSR